MSDTPAAAPSASRRERPRLGAGIFINYRRSDSLGFASWLVHELEARLPGIPIFQDIGVEAGANWVAAIDDAITASGVQLALIGPHWLTEKNDKGRRLDDPQDHTRREIVAALERGLRVIPVLVGGAEIPSERDLPADLRPLTQLQAHELRDQSFEFDVARLVDTLRRIPGLREPTGRRLWRIGRRPLLYLTIAGGVVLAAWYAAGPLLARSALEGIGIEYTDEALVEAARSGDTDAVRLLLRAGADANVRSERAAEYGTTALHAAVIRRDLAMIDALLAHGADPSRAMTAAAARGGLAIIERLVSEGADLQIENSNGETPLMVAAEEGEADLVRFLLDQGAGLGPSSSGKTALMSAAYGDQVEIAELLLARGAGVDEKDDRGWTPLLHAARASSAGVARVLLDAGADPNVEGPHINGSLGWSALAIAVSGSMGPREPSPELVRLLLSRGVAPDRRPELNLGPLDGPTPLMLAVHRLDDPDTRLAIVRALLEHGSDVNAEDDDGTTALLLATVLSFPSPELVELLVASGADVNAANRSGRTALMVSDVSAIARILLDRGADVSLADSRGRSALHYCGVNASIFSPNADQLRNRVEKTRMLLERGAIVNARDEDGVTPLMLAASDGLDAVVRVLLESRASVNERDLDGKTALAHAAAAENPEVERLLRRAGGTL